MKKKKINDSKEESLDMIEVKEKFGTRFINVIKKKWLINGLSTFILVEILIMAFILSTYGIQKLELTPIDFTSDKTYTVSDESKEKVANIDKKINIYLIGYTDDAPATVIAKQYHKANENINVEAIDITQRKDLADKYGIDSNTSQGIIVECGEKSKVLSPNDLSSYDMSSGKSSDITEQKLTASITNVTSDKNTPNVYFLTGYSEFTLEQGMSYFSTYLENENVKVSNLNLLTKGSVPEDCVALIVTTPAKDFEDIATDAIIKYINKGGNILWFNAAYPNPKDLPNVNKVLALYGVKPFETGYTLETNPEKMFYGAPYMIIPDSKYSELTSKTATVLFAQPTKVNMEDGDKLSELKVQRENLFSASDTAFFRKNLSNSSLTKTESDEEGGYIIATQLTKKVENEKESELIIYGENYFVSDMPISQNSVTPLIKAADNKDLALNSLAALTDREEDITVRKSKDEIMYTPTEQQNTIIKIIIFVIPALVIVAGIIVWIMRRRKK